MIEGLLCVLTLFPCIVRARCYFPPYSLGIGYLAVVLAQWNNLQQNRSRVCREALYYY